MQRIQHKSMAQLVISELLRGIMFVMWRVHAKVGSVRLVR
jgi:hypothetical protein